MNVNRYAHVLVLLGFTMFFLQGCSSSNSFGTAGMPQGQFAQVAQNPATAPAGASASPKNADKVNKIFDKANDVPSDQAAYRICALDVMDINVFGVACLTRTIHV